MKYKVIITLKTGDQNYEEHIDSLEKIYMSGLNLVVDNGFHQYQYPHECVKNIKIELMEE